MLDVVFDDEQQSESLGTFEKFSCTNQGVRRTEHISGWHQHHDISTGKTASSRQIDRTSWFVDDFKTATVVGQQSGKTFSSLVCSKLLKRASSGAIDRMHGRLGFEYALEDGLK
jgi:hypothetical protein